MIARMWRTSTPGSIEEDLALLWRDAGREGPVARALMANLVVYRDRPPGEHLDLDAPIEDTPVDEVACRVPSRLILLYHCTGPHPRAPVAATIGILLYGPPQMRVGVEAIAIRVACADESLPSIVRRLARGGVPTSVWWTEDVSTAPPLNALVTMGRQLLYDSRRWRDVRRGMLALSSIVNGPDALDVADLNWRRLTPLRQALIQAFAPATGLTQLQRVRITYRPGDSALAWLLAGWLCSRLGWAAAGEWPIQVGEARRGDDILSIVFSTGDRDDLEATMNGHRVLVRYKTRVAPFSLAVPHEGEADAVAAELQTLTADLALRDTLVALARRFERQ